MAEGQNNVVTGDGLQLFHLQLSKYEMYQLRILYEYFRNDLVYIVESLDTLSLLRELNARKILALEYYQCLKEQLGARTFSEMLVEDILDMGKEAVLGFWESLYSLQTDHPHPNLLGVLHELIHTGHTLHQQISLDEHGHTMLDQLRACHENHKQRLLEKTRMLQEHRAPGINQQPKSFPISERYLDLIVVSSHHFRKRAQHEIIETGGIHEHYLQKAESTLERISPNRLFRWCHRARCVPHSVIVSGVPGVGKTTLMQKLVYDWVNGKLYQRFAFVFFFKFRNLNKLGKVSLETMILEEYPYLQGKLKEILGDPEKLLFIFDGLDETKHQMDFKSDLLCTHPENLNHLGVIVVSLVRQSLLKGCSVLITSRPTKLSSVETKAFQRVSEIMGFFPKQREMYFNGFFGNMEMSQKAFNYVRENGILYTFCFIPSYCWIICTVLSMCFKHQSSKSAQQIELSPKTVTHLFVTFVTNILSNHSQNTENAREFFTSIGWMAEHGVMKQTFEFDVEDLHSFNVKDSIQLLSSFMVESMQPPSVTRSFFHLTIQEFFAALVHYLDYSKENLQKSLDQALSFEDGRGEIFLRFICGLSDHSTISLLQPYLGEFSTSASEHVITWLHKSFSLKETTDQWNIFKRKTLNFFTYLFESRNKVLVSESIGSNPTFNFSHFFLAPLDCTVLAFIFESYMEIDTVDLTSSYIQSEGLERIWPTLHKIQNLSLCHNDLKDSDLPLLYSIITNPMCRIQTLNLRNNSLTEKSCCPLAFAIKDNKSLIDLNLSKNRLAGPDFQDLVMALSAPNCRIQHLSLQEIKLTHNHSTCLFTLNNNRNLTHLNISNNYFSDNCVGDIRDLVLRSTSLKEIRVELNEFSQQVEAELKQLKTLKPGLNFII